MIHPHAPTRARHATRLGAILVLLAFIGAEQSGRASQGLPPYQEILLPGNAFAGVVRGPGGGLYGVTYAGGLNNLGTIFVASNDLSQVTTLWHFNGTDGSVPYAELTVGSGSTLYGTTSRGGAGGAGTVFKFEGGTLTTLASFGFGSGGLSSPLLLLGDYLYGSTSSFPGGSSIFRVPTSGGDPEFLHFFSVAADGSAPDGQAPGALTLGPDGFLYGTALYGGDPTCYPAPYSGCGTIFRLRPEPDPNGFEVIYTFRPPPPPPPPPPGEEEEAPAPPVTFPQRKIVIGSDQRLYGTTFAVVFGLPLDGGNPDGSDLQTLHRIPKFSSIFTPPIEGLDGRIYFTEYSGGVDDAGTVSSVQKDAANPDLRVHHAFAYDDGGGYGPYGILFQDSAGTLFGTTEYSSTPSENGVVFAIRGTNLAPIAAATAPATAAAGGPNCLASVTLDGTGSSDPNGDVLTYSWKEGATVIATGSAPTVQLAVGSHTITLTVRDPSGATDSEAVTVVVSGGGTLTYQGPALLQGNNANVVSALLVDAGGPIAAASVTFTVGGVTYPATTDAAGIASVTVPIPAGIVSAVIQIDYAAGACGAATTTTTVPVNRWPVAAGSALAPNPTGPACVGDVNLDASASVDPDSDPLTYLWQEGATTLSTAKTAVVSLPGGTHQLTLTVSDGRGGSSVTSMSVEVRGELSMLAYTGPAQMASGLSTSVSAKLTTAAGTPIVGATIFFSLDGSTSNAVTDAAGVATTNVTASTTGGRSLRLDYVAADFCHQSVRTDAPVEVAPQAATITVITIVTNDDDGNKTPADFTINVFGVAPVPAQFPGNAAGTTVTLNAGGYSVTAVNVPGYDTSYSAGCNGAIALGETKTCIVTNNDRPTTLRLSNEVNNNNGGLALPSAWTLNGNGQPFATGTVVEVAPGDYTLTETGGPSGYTASGWVCAGGAVNGNVVTVAATATVACTITNDDQPATLTLTKTVLNNDRGNAVAADWTLTAGGRPFATGVSAPIDAGTYILAESGGPPGYAASAWTCNGGVLVGASLTLVPGEVRSCGITNDDQAAYLLVIKHVINNSGGLRGAADFSMNVTGGAPAPATSAGSEVGTLVTLTPGPYTVTETGPRGYDATYSADCTGTLAMGESKTCTVTNDDRLPAAPVANDRLVTTLEDIAVNITVTGSDADGDPLTFVIVSLPAHGTLSGQAPALTYTPEANYNGQDTFTFKVNDGLFDSNVATVTITLTPVNDPPIATPQLVSTPEDVALGIALTGTDVDGDSLTFSVETQPLHGQLTGIGANLTYTPNANYNGPDSFTFRASDGLALSAPATISITVTPVNDAPTAAGQALTTAEDVALGIVLAGSDIDGDALGFGVGTGPAHGNLSGVPPNVIYTPDRNYFGADSFTFTANDGQLVSNVATVSITVTPVNDPPSATDDASGTAPRTAVTITVLANDTDIDGGPLGVTAAGPAGNGTVVRNANGSITYTPANKFAGTDTFAYTISDGQGGTATATVRVTVAASANAPPRAGRDTPTTTMNTPIAIAVLANDSDPDGDPLSLVAVTPPADGVAVANADGTITYTPAAGFRGQDRFTYTVSDGRGGTAIGDVRVRVR